MWGLFATPRACRVLPFMTASWTDTAGPECMPEGAAIRCAYPAVVWSRPISAFWAIYVRIVAHGSFLLDIYP